MVRRKRDGKKNFVFEQRTQIHFLATQHPVRAPRVHRLCLNLCLAARKHQHCINLQRIMQWTQAPLAGQLQEP